MAYEYSSESQTFDLPNPYRFQNRILFVCAGVLMLAGLYALWGARTALASGASVYAIWPLALGVGMIGIGVMLLAKASQRLRFYFGRDKPASLAPIIPADATGTSERAAAVADTLRQRALLFTEPAGAVQGVLYHQFPKLLTAPETVKRQAERHFINLAAVVMTVLSFVLAWGILGDPVSRPWVSMLYFAFGAFWLLRPVAGNQTSKFGMVHLIGLIAAALLAPVVLRWVALKLPPLEPLAFHWQTITLLLGALVATGLVFAASVSQMTAAPSTGVSNHLSRLSLQSPPSTLFDELQRLLQAQWTEKIPNRRYIFTAPSTPLSEAGGSFQGELLEETQPFPASGRNPESLQQLLSDASKRYLVFSDLFGAFLLLGAAALFTAFSAQYNPFVSLLEQPWALLSSGILMIFVGTFCFKNSEVLWGRFDFISQLVWVQTQGAWQRASVGTGNQFSSQLQTQNQLIRVEDMTLNVWRAQVESVVFGQGLGRGLEARQIMAMSATEPQCNELVAQLQQFVANQSILTSPQSKADAGKMEQIFSSERLAKAMTQTKNALLGDAGETTSSVAIEKASRQGPSSEDKRYCSHCGASVDRLARFCSACGTALAA